MELNETINIALSELDYSAEPQGLYAPIRYALDAGGKRVRPMLALIANRLYGGKQSDIMPAALALEVFHNFTLLHDDLMDNADTRRGRPAVHRKWDSNTAILSGDQMLIEAYKLIAQVPQRYLSTCLALFSKMATEICEGQQYDMQFEKQQEVSIEQYTEMIRLKTAVLPATALQIGALIAGADQAQQDILYRFGINMGIAFQLRDDYLDVYGDPATFGKAIGGDILDNKKTYLYLSAYRQANEQQTELLDRWFGSENKQEKIEHITALYTHLGADKLCLQEIEQYHARAKQNLNQLSLDQQQKQPLYDLLEQLLNREK